MHFMFVEPYNTEKIMNHSLEIADTIKGKVRVKIDLSDIVGMTMSSVKNLGHDIQFISEGGQEWHLYHIQSCCEKVYLEEVIGDLEDLIGTPILKAEEVSNISPKGKVKKGKAPKDVDYFTWTFYIFRTVKGSVTLRWLGTSNGSYSERVDFTLDQKLKKKWDSN